MPQKEIRKAIDLGQIINQCMLTGKVKVPSTGEYVGYRFEEPYDKISHGYSSEAAEDQIMIYRMLRNNVSY